MTYLLIIIAVVLFVCVFLNNASNRIGLPVLLAFILFGIAFHYVPFFSLAYEANRESSSDLCSAALLFIMFYGGFGTRWSAAKAVVTESGLLASVGVILTAAVTGALCHFLLRWGWVEGLLLGAALSSTDAASVFSILRSRKLGLKNHTAPMLEVESGSNDPCSYMLTILMLSVLEGRASGLSIGWMLLAQIGIGVLFGAGIAWLSVHAMRRISFATEGFDSMFVLAIAIASYALPTALGGNGYLSAYIVGIVLGNQDFAGKKELVHFFDGFTSLMQVLIFFMLGLLASLSDLNLSIPSALAVFGFLLFVARPVAVAAVLLPFRKYSFKQILLVCFCGLRGASSIVFAILATGNVAFLQHDIFDIVFCVVLLSISLQGTLIPYVARRLDMIDDEVDVMSTFNDFSEETEMTLSQFVIQADSAWKDKPVRQLGLPKDLLICMVQTPAGDREVPNGSTVLHEGDKVIVCAHKFHAGRSLGIRKKSVGPDSPFVGMALRDLPLDRHLIVLIRRDGREIIPYGSTVIEEGDILYVNQIAL